MKWLVLILIFAAFLRFYQLPQYMRFLGDEGRDVLVVKQMIVDHKWTLLGPTASVGGFYTGPIYYYFMLPFLWAFSLNPVGPAVMAALFGLATIVLIYYFCRDLFDERVALIAAFLTAISPKMVDISRFSWNPNPVPFFALGAIYALYKKRCLLAGICVGVLYQLHYIDLVFIPIVGLSMLLIFPWRQWFLQILLLVVGFLIGDALFLLFELRHGFPNTKTALEFIFRGTTVAPRQPNILFLINDITRIFYEIVLGFRGFWLNVIYYVSISVLVFWAFTKKEKTKISLLAVWWLVGAFGVGLYRGTLLDHYLGFLFPVPIILTALLGGYLWKNKLVFVVFLGIILWFSVPNLYLWHKPNNLVAQTQAVDKIVLELAGSQPYNFALITKGNSDHAYRYFLEVWKKKPVTIEPPQSDPERKTVTNQLIVVCEEECDPRGDPTWEVAGFGRAEIDRAVTGPVGIKVIRLVHYTGE